MTYKIALLITSLLSVLLFSCSTYQNLKIDTDINEIKILPLQEINSINGDYMKSFNKEEHVKTIIDAFTRSTPIVGDVDMPEPDYYVQLSLGDQTEGEFYLWLSDSNSKGTLTPIDDTATAYNLSKKATNNILELLSY